MRKHAPGCPQLVDCGLKHGLIAQRAHATYTEHLQMGVTMLAHYVDVDVCVHTSPTPSRSTLKASSSTVLK